MPNSEPIQSVLRASDVLQLIGESDDGLALQSLADRLGLKAPTVHHLLRTLVITGLLQRVTGPVRYRIGPLFHQIARRQAGVALYEIVEPAMRKLSDVHGQATVVLAEFIDSEVVVTRRMRADQPNVMQQPPHQVLGPYTSASALLFQSQWPSEMRRAFRRRYPLAEYGGAWTDETELNRFLRNSAKAGVVAYLSGNRTHLAVSAAVKQGGQLLGAIGASMTLNETDDVDKQCDRLAKSVHDASIKISRQLGRK